LNPDLLTILAHVRAAGEALTPWITVLTALFAYLATRSANHAKKSSQANAAVLGAVKTNVAELKMNTDSITAQLQAASLAQGQREGALTERASLAAHLAAIPPSKSEKEGE
jgi:hypothetical protein